MNRNEWLAAYGFNITQGTIKKALRILNNGTLAPDVDPYHILSEATFDRLIDDRRLKVPATTAKAPPRSRKPKRGVPR